MFGVCWEIHSVHFWGDFSDLPRTQEARSHTWKYLEVEAVKTTCSFDGFARPSCDCRAVTFVERWPSNSAPMRAITDGKLDPCRPGWPGAFRRRSLPSGRSV